MYVCMYNESKTKQNHNKILMVATQRSRTGVHDHQAI